MSGVDTANLRAEEKAIAERFISGFPWAMAIWPIVNTGVWLALWPLALTGTLPFWAAFPIAIVNVAASYLPSHEAQHNNYFRQDSRWHWVNEALGWFSLIPLALPLSALRATHLEHHRHTNNPELDPDYPINAPNVWAALGKSMAKMQPRHEVYGATLLRLNTPYARAAILHTLVCKMIHFGILAALAWSGYVWEALFLWWLPHKIGLTYINFYLSWAPHYPNGEQGRYRDTRAFKSIWGNIGSSGMQYHIVHHLYPNIPLDRNPAAFRALRPVLEARGCDLGGM